MTDTDELLESGWKHLEEGDIDAARRMGEKLLATEEGGADGLLLLAACAREEGSTQKAVGHLQQAASADPDWATPHLWLAELLSSEEGTDRLSEALACATKAVDLAEEEEEYLDALALKANLEVDLGKLDMARKTLSELPPADAAQLPGPLALEFAHLFFALGDLAESRRRFEALTDDEPDNGDAWYGLGLAAEGLNDEAAKRKAWLKTLALDQKLDDDGGLSEEEVESVAEGALQELPAKARKLLQNVPILIADLPARDDVADGLDPRLLGLFAGTPLTEASTLGGSPQLTQIVLFQRNLERVTSDPDQMRDEVRTTLLHETGHFFGLSEEDLAGVGLD